VKNGLANIVLNIKGNPTENEVPLQPETILLDKRTVIWLDLMYSILPLQSGGSLSVSALFPEDFEVVDLGIKVRPAQEEITVGETAYTVFVCDVPYLDEVHYVTDEGQLVRIVRNETGVTIDLAEHAEAGPAV